MTDLEVIFNTIIAYDTLNKNIYLFVDPAWDPRKETSKNLKGYVLVVKLKRTKYVRMMGSVL